MAVAFDASSESHAGASGATITYSWTHTPVGTPRGVLVYTFNRNGTAHELSGVTYGGVAMVEVVGGTASDTTGSTEGGNVTAWFLGSGIPTGAQTVQCTEAGTITGGYAVCITVTASQNTTYAGVIIEQNDQILTEENVDDGSPGANSVRFAGILSGIAAVPAAGANSTAVQSIDYGLYVNAVVRETTAGQGSRPVGATTGSTDDVAAVYLAIVEQAASTRSFAVIVM